MAYCPESPRASTVYEPTSPRSTRLYDPNFRPIHYPDDYLRIMKKFDGRLAEEHRNDPARYNKFAQECIERYEKFEYNMKKRDHLLKVPQKTANVIQVPDKLDHITTRMSVVNGKVKLQVYTDMAVLNENYMSKGKTPPRDKYVKALKRFGYPDEILHKVLNKKSSGDHEFLDQVFSKYNVKTSTTKKRTRHKVFRDRSAANKCTPLTTS